MALREDIGRGDITTESLFKKDDRRVKAYLSAREDLVFAGRGVFEEVFRNLGGKVRIRWFLKDGDGAKKNTKICSMEGSLKSILKGERTALNFVQRLSGIATMTNTFVKSIGSKRTRILDTRKTTPLLRFLEKYAVRVGGGSNHRMGLYDKILVKDNHIALFGSVKRALNALSNRRRGWIEVEAKNLTEVSEAIAGGANVIMLDNMSTDKIKKAVKLIRGKAKIEVSGGMNASRIGEIAKLGVDYISVGALTHSARSVDISLEIQ